MSAPAQVPEVWRGDGRYGNTPPPRSREQMMDALRRGNEVRSRRAELKRDLKHGRRGVSDVLMAPPEFVESMKVFDLLMAVPKVGRVKANRTLQHERVSPSKTIGGLSERQRAALIAALGPQR